MKVWLRYQREALNRAVKRLRQAPFAALISVLVIGMALALPVGLYLTLLNLHSIAGRINAEPQISVFLTLDSGPADIQTFEAALKGNRSVARYQFISKDQALMEMRDATGLGDALDTLDKNPLPHAFVVRAKTNTPEALEALRNDLSQLPKAEFVQLDSAWAKRLAAFNSAGEKIVLILAVALGSALLAVIGNTIRLQILMQREEIEVGRLIGATDNYVRRPYLYFGALQGLLGGIIAMALAVAALFWLSDNISELIQIYAPGFRPQAVSWQTSTVIVAAAALLGWLGAYASVSMYLRQLTTAPR